MPESCMPPIDVRSSELEHFQFADSWNSRTRCARCPGIRTPSLHATCCRNGDLKTSAGFSQMSEDCDQASLLEGKDHGSQRRVSTAKGSSSPQKKARAKESSRHFGVRYRPDLSKWVAEIRVAQWKPVDKKVWLGTFDTEEGAARAVDSARKLLKCGKKRSFNFPCDRLTAYSEQIPSHINLTDVENETMFKYVTRFVKMKSQEYAAGFCPNPGKPVAVNIEEQMRAEECQSLAVLSGPPVSEGTTPKTCDTQDSCDEGVVSHMNFDEVEEKPTVFVDSKPTTSDVSTIYDTYPVFDELDDSDPPNRQYWIDDKEICFTVENSDFVDHVKIFEGYDNTSWSALRLSANREMSAPLDIDVVGGHYPISSSLVRSNSLFDTELSISDHQLLHSADGFQEDVVYDYFFDSADPVGEYWLQPSYMDMSAEMLEFESSGESCSPVETTFTQQFTDHESAYYPFQDQWSSPAAPVRHNTQQKLPTNPQRSATPVFMMDLEEGGITSHLESYHEYPHGGLAFEFCHNLSQTDLM